jgi:pseudouridine synthase
VLFISGWFIAKTPQIDYPHSHMSEPVRINKYLADHHYCSRREADRLIASGNVFLNNRPAKLGDKVGDSDTVRVNGRDRGQKSTSRVYLMMNKPAGISLQKKTEHTVYDLIDLQQAFFPVGEMSMRDEGLLILTNDSFFSKRLSLPNYTLDQEFVVEVNKPISRGDIVKLQNGIQLKDGMTKPVKARQLDSHRFAIIPSETKQDLIRRMCAELGYEVETLMRTRILTLKMISTYPVGNWRNLTESEVEDLKKAAGITLTQKAPKQKPWTENKKKKLARERKSPR